MDNKSVESARESIQENLIAYLDGKPQELIDAVCQIVVDGFKPLTK